MSFRRTVRAKSRNRAHSSAGFALIEVLVAVAVASVLMAVLIRSFVSTWAGVNIVREEAEGTMLARSMLDEALLRGVLSPGSQDGTLARYAWNVTTTMQTIPTVAPKSSQEGKQAPTTANIFHIAITMRGPSGRSNRLDAYKIGQQAVAQ